MELGQDLPYEGLSILPTLIVDNIPLEIYQRSGRANASKRSVGDKAINLLQVILRQEEAFPTPRLPDLVPTEEIHPPCDLPRPGPTTRVSKYPGRPRLPDPPLEVEMLS